MKVLIVAASYLEIKEILRTIDFKSNDKIIYNADYKNNDIDILISGIGVVCTMYSLTKKLLNKQYDLVINIGIAGSFNKNIKIGDVVLVKEEQFGDLGIEDKNNFQTLFEAGLISMNNSPYKNCKLYYKKTFYRSIKNLIIVKALTVNTVSGNKVSIENLNRKFNADIESMEGGAFFYVCLMENVKFLQIRAISNYVEERNKNKWDIPLSINNLTKTIINLLDELSN